MAALKKSTKFTAAGLKRREPHERAWAPQRQRQSMVIASTEGNTIVLGTDLSIGLNVYRKA